MVVDEDLDPGAHHSTQASLSVRHKWENRSWVNNTLRQAPGVTVNSRARLIPFPRCLTTPVPPVCYTSEDPNSSTLDLSPCYTPMSDDWLDFAVAVVSVRQFVGNTVLYETQLVRQRRSIMQLDGWKDSCVRKQRKQKKIDEKTDEYINSTSPKLTLQIQLRMNEQPLDYECGETKVMSSAKRDCHELLLLWRTFTLGVTCIEEFPKSVRQPTAACPKV